MDLTPELKNYLNTKKRSLQKNDLKDVYSFDAIRLGTTLSELTEFFLSCGINPFAHMDKVPSKSLDNTSKVTDIVIPSNVDSIEANAFEGSGLKNITLEEGVRVIKNKAFSDCDNLREIYLPESVTTIGAKVWPDNIIIKSPPRKRGTLRFPKSELAWYKEHLVVIRPEGEETVGEDV